MHVTVQLYAYIIHSLALFRLSSTATSSWPRHRESQIETAKTEAIIRARVRFVSFCFKLIHNNNDNSNNSNNKNNNNNVRDVAGKLQ